MRQAHILLLWNGEHQLLQAAGEPAHERPIGIVEHRLSGPEQDHPRGMVEKGLPAQGEEDRHIPGGMLSDDPFRAFHDLGRTPHPSEPQGGEVEVDLLRHERGVLQGADVQADESLGVVGLPVLDAVAGGNLGRREIDQARGRASALRSCHCIIPSDEHVRYGTPTVIETPGASIHCQANYPRTSHDDDHCGAEANSTASLTR